MTKPRVLFVDDNEHVLGGLQNLLRRKRDWDMTFVGSGAAALAELDRRPFDVIVSDMQMPEMDGATLLEAVTARHPTLARIVLSGYANRTAMVRALSVAHRYLTKPCETGVLLATIEGTLQLQTLLADTALRNFVGRLGALPPSPDVYLRLTRAVSVETVSAAQVASIIESDPSLTIKVLQLVNSAFFGLSRPVVSIQQAVTYLGVDLLRGVVLTVHTFDAISTLPNSAAMRHLQGHSLMVARVARAIAPPEVADGAFTAGITHDVGKIVLGVGAPEMFARIASLAREGQRPFHAVEQDMARVTHAEIGAYLLGMWGLPFEIVEAVAYHHTPQRLPAGGDRRVVTALHVADALVHRSDAALDNDFLESMGLVSSLPKWRDVASELTAARSAA